MADEKDIVEFGLGYALDKAAGTGRFSIMTRSRFVSAVDRLLGGMAEFPAAWFESRVERRRHEEELRRRWRETCLSRAEAALNSGTDADIANIEAVAAWGQLDGIINLKSVIAEALLELPERDEVEVAIPSTIGADWINVYRTAASSASSDELRSLWARVLAEEVRKPGSFRPATLRFVAELDAQLAEACEVAAKWRVASWLYLPDEKIDGEFISSLLETAGLITDHNLPYGEFELGDDGVAVLRCDPLAIRFTGQPGAKLAIYGDPLTATGKEVFSLLKGPDSDDAMRRVAEQAAKAKPVKKVELATVPLGAENDDEIVPYEVVCDKTKNAG